MKSFNEDFQNYVLSGHAILSVTTHEKDRVIEQIKRAAGDIKKNVFCWSIASGWKIVSLVNKDEKLEDPPKSPHPVEALAYLENIPSDSICIFKDFGVYVDKDTCTEFDVVTAILGETKEVISNQGQTIVFVGPDFKIPNVLRHDITEMDFALPNREDIAEQVKYVCEGVELANGEKFEPNENLMPEIVGACQGMTQQQVIDRVALALRKHKNFTSDAVRTLVHEKGNTIKSSGLLNFIEPPEGGLDLIGGYEVLKRHILLDKPCFGDEAKNFGIDAPKGFLAAGLPGCGKTAMATAIASEFGFPLISLDIGRCMGSLVGESEKNIREAIKVIESISPCAVILDEIEKGVGGTDSVSDGGSSKRVLGTLLNWLSERTSSVYIVATSNNATALPVEFLRSGRFDAIFGFGLPNKNEREQIFKIHISKRDRDPDQFDISKLIEKTNGYTGSDIEQVVKLSLKIAFSLKEKLGQFHLESAINNIIPLSKTEPERLKAIENWCVKHCIMANSADKSDKEMKRKVVV